MSHSNGGEMEEQASSPRSPVEALARIACALVRDRYPEAPGTAVEALAAAWLKAAGNDLLGAVVEQGRRS